MIKHPSSFPLTTCPPNRQRRIKCDETKPECLRCQRSQRFCAGTAYRGFTPSERDTLLVAVAKPPARLASPSPSLASAATAPAGSRGLSQLACTIFAADSHCLFGPAEALFFSRLLPQFSDSIPFVSAAAAAFGAAYRAGVLKDERAVTRSEVQYMKAIRLLQNELTSPLQRFIPFFISSILLAGAEVISGRRRNAVVHLLSVFSIFFPNDSEASKSEEGVRRLIPAVNEIRSAGGSADDFDYVLLALDIQIALYAWSKPPVLSSRFHTINERPTTVDELIKQQPIIMHACMHFIGEILQENETRGHVNMSLDRLSEQSRLLAAIHQWLAHHLHLLTTESLASSRLHYLAVLAAQCYSILITTSTILTSTQTSYDAHHPSFTKIIHLAESVLGPCPLPPAGGSPSSSIPVTAPSHVLASQAHDPLTSHPPFSPSAGLIPCLSLTARKCRDPRLRRQAIALLLRTGKEGPLVGVVEAALGRRVCEIEEGGRKFGFAVPSFSGNSVRVAGGSRQDGKEKGKERGKGKGKGKEETKEGQDVRRWLREIVPENRRVRACWRTSMMLPERLHGLVRFARPVESGIVREWAREGQGEGTTVGGGPGDMRDAKREDEMGAEGGQGGVQQEQEMHLEVWAEKISEFEIVDGLDGGKQWTTTMRTPEVWNEWLDPKAWRLLPFEII